MDSAVHYLVQICNYGIPGTPTLLSQKNRKQNWESGSVILHNHVTAKPVSKANYKINYFPYYLVILISLSFTSNLLLIFN